MAYNKYKFYDYNSPYKDSKGITNARNSLLAIKPPTYSDSYAQTVKDAYGRIKNQKEFYYNPQNDAAYRQYADEYRALVGAAIADNQAAAQNLTSGYGSTFAPYVAQQGEARLNAGVEAAQPAFYQLAQQAYDVNQENLYNAYSAAAARRDAEMQDYLKQADIYNDRYNRAADIYNALEDRGYDRYMGNKEFNYNQNQMNISQEQANKDYKLEKWDTYYTLAEGKCQDYQDKKNNKGMKNYLKGLVGKGKITQYMADELYKKYKYVAPKTSGGGGGGGRGRGRGRGYGGGGGKNGVVTVIQKQIINGKEVTNVIGTYDSGTDKNYTVTTNMLQQIGMSRTNEGKVEQINKLTVDDDLKNWLVGYYGI